MIKKILIANRGEIALRILRTCKQMGIQTVAVYAEPDRDLMHVRLADEAICIGPAQAKHSYLNIAPIIGAAQITNADAIHPGYGFLSERADFAEAVESCGLIFIGPTPATLHLMSNKVSARRKAIELGLPTLPGSAQPINQDIAKAQQIAQQIGFPLMLKAAAGGGGRGMRVVDTIEQLQTCIQVTAQEAQHGFGNSDLYLERFLQDPRHVEVQVVGDGKGNAIHLGDRDCSLQRKHQKLVEEAPAPQIDSQTRAKLHQSCVQAAQQLNYRGVGTFEFLYDQTHFYFIEMNTRIQVEHTVTEAITGIDVVREQILIASGKGLSLSQAEVSFQGHALECRINAEHPLTFTPSPGRVKHYHPPGGAGVRMDTHLYSGYIVPPHYDSLLGKLICHGPDRGTAIARARCALEEILVEGIDTNISFLKDKILSNPEFISDKKLKQSLNIHLIKRILADEPVA